MLWAWCQPFFVSLASSKEFFQHKCQHQQHESMATVSSRGALMLLEIVHIHCSTLLNMKTFYLNNISRFNNVYYIFSTISVSLLILMICSVPLYIFPSSIFLYYICTVCHDWWLCMMKKRYIQTEERVYANMMRYTVSR